MNILIVTDFEGIACIEDFRQIFTMYADHFPSGRIQITEDVNAAIRGFQRAGASEITILDRHAAGTQQNIIENNVEGDFPVLRPRSEHEVLEIIEGSHWDGLATVGYHAMAGTADGFMSHTSTMWIGLDVNEAGAGEFFIAAASGGYFAIPTIFASGDQALTREARSLVPSIVTASVKISSTRYSTKCMSRREANALLEREAELSIKNLRRVRPVTIDRPVNLRLTFAVEHEAELAGSIPGATRNHNIVSYRAEDFREAVRAYSAMRDRAWSHINGLLISRLRKLDEAKVVADKWQSDRYAKWMRLPHPFLLEDYE